MRNKIRRMIPILIFAMVASLFGGVYQAAPSSARTEIIEVGSWAELQEMIDGTVSKDIVYQLTDDIVPAEEDSALVIHAGVLITIDLNGKTINRNLVENTQNGYVIVLEEKAKLSIVDSSEDGGGQIIGGKNTEKGGGIYVSKGAILSLEDVKISGNEAKCGGGIYLDEDSSVTMKNASIVENTAETTGGGIASMGGQITFAGGAVNIKNNRVSGDDNDGVYFIDFRKMMVTGKFDKNSRIVFMLPEFIEVLTEGYGENNSVEPNFYFLYKASDDKYKVSDSLDDSEVKLVKDIDKVNNKKTHTVEVLSPGGILKSEKDFSNLGQAWSYAAANSVGSGKAVIILGQDEDTKGMLGVAPGCNIVLDLNGHYINRGLTEPEDDGAVIFVDKLGTLLIKDSNPKSKGFDGVKGGVITGGFANDTAGGIHIEEGGSVTMQGGTIYNCVTNEDGGAVKLVGDVDKREKTSFTMTGGTISSCHTLDSADSCYGGGIFARGATLRIKNATFKYNYVEDDGGAIAIEKCDVMLDKTVFSENKAKNDGGAVCIRYTKSTTGTRFTARDCKFIGNHAVDSGGALYIGDNGDNHVATMINRCVFKDNDSDEKGGAISVCDDAVAFSEIEITDNYAKKNGGGVFVDARYKLALKGKIVIKDNSCGREAGADLCLENGTSSDACVIDVGLMDGSYVGIGSSADKEVVMGKDISEFHLKYFHPAKGSVGLKEKYNKKEGMALSASLISSGYMIALIIMGAVGLLLLIVAWYVSGKRRRANS